MDPLLFFLLIAGLYAVVGLSFWIPRARFRGDDSMRRTSWRIICSRCQQARRAEPDCEECRSDRMQPLSKYQAAGGGTGFWLDPHGSFISSLREGEWKPSDADWNLPQGRRHAPIFDLDFQAELSSHRSGTTLILKKGMWDYQRAALQLLFQGLRLAPRQLAAGTKDRGRLPGVEGYRANDPTYDHQSVFELSVPCKLVPSSTEGHFHLYLETVMDWPDYLRLMRVMAEAGLLERDWVDMNERRKMAMLRKPEYKKAPT